MFFADRLTLDKPTRTRDGFLAVRARAARIGVYDYTGREVDPDNKHGLRDESSVKVLRDERTVFDEAAARSFIGKPITDDHPSEPVTRDNWRDHARGTVMGALRDGDYLAFDLLLTDGKAIDKVDAGKRELSNGYSTDLEFGEFTAADGTKCQARQIAIAGNHVALVDKGRAGSSCAITDGLPVCDAITATELDRLKASISDNRKDGTMPHTLIIDGLQVPNVSDEAKACVEKLQGQVKDATEGRAADKTAHDKALAAKDTEIDDLKGKVVDQAAIDALADAKAEVVGKAKAVCGDKLPDTAGKTVAEVRRMAVAAKLGDERVKDKSDDYVEATFDRLAEDGGDKPIVPGGITQPLSTDGTAKVEAARAAWFADKQTAYRGQTVN